MDEFSFGERGGGGPEEISIQLHLFFVSTQMFAYFYHILCYYFAFITHCHAVKRLRSDRIIFTVSLVLSVIHKSHCNSFILQITIFTLHNFFFRKPAWCRVMRMKLLIVLMKMIMKQRYMTSDEDVSDSDDSDICDESDDENSSPDDSDDDVTGVTGGIWACLIGDDPGPVPVPFTTTPGPIHSPGVNAPPTEYFSLFFPDGFLRKIVHEMNKYSDNFVRNNREYFSTAAKPEKSLRF